MFSMMLRHVAHAQPSLQSQINLLKVQWSSKNLANEAYGQRTQNEIEIGRECEK